MRTKYLPVKYRGLVQNKFPSSGYRPCISGMKKLYYGKDCISVMCGGYMYYLGHKMEGEAKYIYELAH